VARLATGWRRARASSLLAVRVVALLVALAALGWALRLGARRDPSPAAVHDGYVCPMHPDARAAMPGVCAICRMPLRAAPAEAAIPDDVIGAPLELAVAREVDAPAWRDGDRVAALLYADELALLGPGETAWLRLGRQSFTVRRDGSPPRRWDDATFYTTWRLVDGQRASSSAQPRSRPLASLAERARAGDGTVGSLELARRTRPVLVVPYAAVIASPAGPYVLVVDGRAITPRPIVTGRTLFDYVSVLGGVAAEERLIVRDAIAFDHQLRLATEAP
jgi:hypothetical protein